VALKTKVRKHFFSRFFNIKAFNPFNIIWLLKKFRFPVVVRVLKNPGFDGLQNGVGLVIGKSSFAHGDLLH